MKKYISRKDISFFSTDICTQLLPLKNKFNTIVGISRGGLYLSHWLSYVLDKPHTTITIQRYVDDDRPHTLITSHLDNIPLTEQFLLVDDIIDSGETVNIVKQYVNNRTLFYIASFHWCKEHSPFIIPSAYAETKTKTDWIVYPWESDIDIDNVESKV